jgi:hypothetical protein
MKTALLACAALAGCVLPAKPTDPLEPATSLAAAERAFATQSVREDARTAFLANFAPGGVLVRNAWVEAIPALTADAPWPVVLDWHPAYVEAARSGELGLSTGPWKATRQDGSQASGDFVSVWRRDAGRWQVVADIGVAHAPSMAWDAPLDTRVGRTAQCPAFDDAERAFAHEASIGGLRAALRRQGAEDLRFYREGELPVRGSGEAIGMSLDEAAVSYAVDASAVARSGELAYARGSYAAGARARGVWLRVWRCELGSWRVLLDIANATR